MHRLEPIVRGQTREQDEQRHRAAPHVGFRAVGFGPQHLRRGEKLGPLEPGEVALPAPAKRGGAEVDDDQTGRLAVRPPAPEHDVIRLHVPVHDAHRVHERARPQKLRGDVFPVARHEPLAPPDGVEELPPVVLLRDDVEDAPGALLERAVDRGDVGVAPRNREHGVDLVADALLRALRAVRGDGFHRARLARAPQRRRANRAVLPAAQQRAQLVDVAKTRPGGRLDVVVQRRLQIRSFPEVAAAGSNAVATAAATALGALGGSPEEAAREARRGVFFSNPRRVCGALPVPPRRRVAPRRASTTTGPGPSLIAVVLVRAFLPVGVILRRIVVVF